MSNPGSPTSLRRGSSFGVGGGTVDGSGEADTSARKTSILTRGETTSKTQTSERKASAVSVPSAKKPSHTVDKQFITKMESVYDDIVADFPLTIGRAASRRDREDPDGPEFHKQRYLTYNEIEFEAIGVAIEKIKKIYGQPGKGTSGIGVLQHKGGVFYDLGCGTGKVLIAATCMHQFDNCWGIELLGSLVVIASDLIRSYNVRGKQLLERENDTHCSIIHGDFLIFKTSKNWTNGDVVFCNCASFDDDIMAKLADLAEYMKIGSFFITVSKKLPSSEWVVVDHSMLPISFGEATVYIHQKVTDDEEFEED